MVGRNGLAMSALVKVDLARTPGNGPATWVSAIRKVIAIKGFFAVKKTLAVEKTLAIEEALALGKRPKSVAVEAGRRHGKIFSSGMARGAL